MVRTQIQLTEGQARRLRQLAHRRGLSLAEVIRQCIDSSLEASGEGADALYEGAARLQGAGRDVEGRGDLSERHDELLAASFARPGRPAPAKGRPSKRRRP